MKTISVQEVKNLFENKTPFTLLDVRENEELKIAHIKPNTHIPMGQIVERIKELKKEELVVVMCHSGVRSARVCHYLSENGYNSKNLIGGINQWSVEIDQKVPQY